MKARFNIRNNKKWIVIGGIVLILVAARLSMPYFVTRFVNKVLADIPGYQGSIYDVDIALIRGAYVIDSLKIFKIDGSNKVPFVDIAKTDLSVEWRALFQGSVVGEVIFEDAKVNFIGGDGKEGQGNSTNQSGADVDWTVPIKKLMPLQINRMEIDRGTIFFHDFTTNPRVNLSLDDLNMVATNLNNAAKNEEKLPSHVDLTATSIGGGALNLSMDMNVLQKIPDLDMNLKFEKVDMPALNDFFKAYAKIDMERGTFNLYSEIVIDSGKVNGYIKPLATDIKIVDLKEDPENPIKLLWESTVGLLKDAFKNQKENQFATNIPISGDLNSPDPKIWPGVWNIFKNAFVKAFEKNTDNTIKFAGSSPEKKMTKKELRTARKEERREARKKKRAKV